MQPKVFLRTLGTIGVALALLAGATAVAPAVLPTSLAHIAHAQDGQPDDTIVLFGPFWEAWDLLHENYVDPLDDHDLAAGALGGLVAAVDTAGVAAPAIPLDAASTEERFDPFWETWARLHDAASELDDTALMESALSGMMKAVGDPHTDYMPPDMFARINESMSGEYEGIGATVRQHEVTGGLELVTIFDGSPAQAAGLIPGDQIVAVEGTDITHLTQAEIISQVRGPAGTTVRLGILRSTAQGVLEYDVQRGRINIPSVSSRLLTGNIGYIRLSQFEFGTAQDMRDALEQIDANHLAGLILDLRGNPGGYLTTSIEVASAYMREGAVLIERNPRREQVHVVAGDPVAADVPMVVLVDQGSASASELIAGALQDHKRAVVVGMTTFGKGSVQSWRRLSNGGGIRITISRWYTPNGRSVSDVGIEPDVVVPYEPSAVSGGDDNQLTAAIAVLTQGEAAPSVAASEQSAAPATN